MLIVFVLVFFEVLITCYVFFSLFCIMRQRFRYEFERDCCSMLVYFLCYIVFYLSHTSVAYIVWETGYKGTVHNL